MPTDYLAGPTISSSGEKQSNESPIHATQTGKARLDLGVSAGRHKPKCRCFNNFGHLTWCARSYSAVW
jgi:hypothetical protein